MIKLKLIISVLLFTQFSHAQNYEITRGLSLSEISGSGTSIVGLGLNNFVGPIPIGFSFNFFGQNYSEFFIASDGLISFGSGKNGDNYNNSLPSVTVLNSIIFGNAEFDFNKGNPTVNYLVSGLAPTRVLVINFKNVYHYLDGYSNNFQIQLFEATNNIELNIESLDSFVGYAPFGINIPLTIGLQGNTANNYLTLPTINANYELNIYNERIRFNTRCETMLNLTRNVPIDNFSSGYVYKQANNSIGVITANNLITGTARVTYQAKNIQLNSGFKADSGTVFIAELGGCN